MTERTALVTGGGANVGRAIAMRLAEHGLADRIVVNDIDAVRAAEVADEIKALGSAEALAYTANITSWDAVREMFDAVGPVDILVNNAGIPSSFGTPKRFVDTGPEDWKPWLDLNLNAVLYTARCALPAMLDRKWGRVITIVSDAGRTGEPRLGAYGAAKAGAAALMRSIAKETGRDGVTCNSIALGSMRHGAATLTDEQIEQMLSHYIVPRLGENDDPAALVAFLASEEASWISGQTIAVNGGYTVTL